MKRKETMETERSRCKWPVAELKTREWSNFVLCVHEIQCESVMIEKNIKNSFESTGLAPFSPVRVLTRLNGAVEPFTPSPRSTPSITLDETRRQLQMEASLLQEETNSHGKSSPDRFLRRIPKLIKMSWRSLRAHYFPARTKTLKTKQRDHRLNENNKETAYPVYGGAKFAWLHESTELSTYMLYDHTVLTSFVATMADHKRSRLVALDDMPNPFLTSRNAQISGNPVP